MKDLGSEVETLKKELELLKKEYSSLLVREKEEIEAATKKINEKYAGELAIVSKKFKLCNNKLKTYFENISRYSIFSLKELCEVLIDIILLYERKDYTLNEVSFVSDDLISKRVFVLSESSVKLEKKYDYNKYSYFIDFCNNSGVVIFEDVSNDNVKLYSELSSGGVKPNFICTNLPYIKAFIDVAIYNKSCGNGGLKAISDEFLLERFEEIQSYTSKILSKTYSYK